MINGVNPNLQQPQIKKQDEQSPEFLVLTSRFSSNANLWTPATNENKTAENAITADVSYEEIQEQIAKANTEKSIIENSNIKTSSTEILPMPTEFTLEGASPAPVNVSQTSTAPKTSSKTDTTNIFNQITGTAKEIEVLKKSVQLMVDWLDDLITNYDAKTSQGKAQGHQEVKLTTLLQLRNAIKNCDFPIRANSNFADDVGGHYAYSYYPSDPTDKHLDRSIEFPTSLMNDNPMSKYSVAMTLVHELTHSMHIGNEAIAYLMGDTFADDMGLQFVGNDFTGFKETNQDILDFGLWWEQESQSRQNPDYITPEDERKSEFKNYIIA